MAKRVHTVQESDLRMLGSLARTIQRVLPVTQADIDAAAALGQGWVVEKVFEVALPLDNCRGGTQLIIRENSITPGKYITRVMFVRGPGGQEVTVAGIPPLILPDALEEDIVSLKAFGGTYQGLPAGYDPVQFIYFLDGAYLQTALVPTYDCKVEMDFQTTGLTPGGSAGVFGGRSNTSTGCGLSLRYANSIFAVDAFGLSSNDTYASSVAPTSNTRYKFTYDNQVATLESGGSTLFTNTMTGTQANGAALAINAMNSNGTTVIPGAGIYLYSFKMWDNQGNLIANYVPCAKTNPLTVGLYDLVSDTFINAPTSGTWAAGPAAGASVNPTPDAPIDIVCNNGVLKARHQSGLPLGYTLLDCIIGDGSAYLNTGWTPTTSTGIKVEYEYVASGPAGISGTYQVNAPRTDTLFITTNSGATDSTTFTAHRGATQVFQNVELNTRYTGYVNYLNDGKMGFAGETLVDVGENAVYDYPTLLFARYNPNTQNITASQSAIYDVVFTEGSAVSHHLVPAKRNSDNVLGMYDLVSGQFFTNQGTGDFTAGNEVSDPVEIYTDGTVETIAIKDDQNATVSTATCEDLLSVGTYTDEQEVISGGVTRKVGVKVLDGTEEWKLSTATGTSSLFYCIQTNMDYTATSAALCTHYTGELPSVAGSSQADKSVKAGYAGSMDGRTRLYLRDTSFATVSDLTTFLANQYVAGAPVIVVYPLATSTTETVTAQPMSTTEGDNTVEITQASMSGLELEVTYVAGVVLTVEEVEDAQLSPDVEVTIQ